MHFVENKRMFQQIGRFNFKNAGRVIKSDTSICILPHVLNVFDKTPVFYNKNYTSFFWPKHEKLECVIFICKIQHFQTKHKKNMYFTIKYMCVGFLLNSMLEINGRIKIVLFFAAGECHYMGITEYMKFAFQKHVCFPGPSMKNLNVVFLYVKCNMFKHIIENTIIYNDKTHVFYNEQPCIFIHKICYP